LLTIGIIGKTNVGKTTLFNAATLWIVASIGVATGSGFYLLAIVATILAFISLKMTIFERKNQ